MTGLRALIQDLSGQCGLNKAELGQQSKAFDNLLPVAYSTLAYSTLAYCTLVYCTLASFAAPERCRAVLRQRRLQSPPQQKPKSIPVTCIHGLKPERSCPKV